MALSKKEVLHVAALARLELTEKQTETLTNQLNDVLAHMDKLAQVDTEGVPPTTHSLALTGFFREDRVTSTPNRELYLEGAPDTDGESFIVPKVI